MVCVGDFGSEGRKLYSAIGVQANLAARIQSFCEPGRILMCGQTAALIRDEIASTSKAEIPVKHLTYPVPVYEVS
jgi:class 3 adenylate cyclase